MAAKTAQVGPNTHIDSIIAAVLRGERAEWPESWQAPSAQAAFVGRALHHGVAGLLIEAGPALTPWPEAVTGPLRWKARAQTIWEMRHELVLRDLLSGLADRSIPALLLKGTAIAYDLHERPACRARCDTDLLVESIHLREARETLAAHGFSPTPGSQSSDDELSLQEAWHLECADGTRHSIDLHWQPLNSLALGGVLDASECMATSRALPRLCASARTVDRVTMLLHTLLHRAMNNAVPAPSGHPDDHGGHRLIWLDDIDRLARSLVQEEWLRFGELARSKGIARACLEGFRLAHDQLGTTIPGAVLEVLEAAPARQPGSDYLLVSNRLGRNWRDLKAIGNLPSAAAFLAQRVFPSRAFMTMKYPGAADRALVRLYLRRFAGVLRNRPGRSST